MVYSKRTFVLFFCIYYKCLDPRNEKSFRQKNINVVDSLHIAKHIQNNFSIYFLIKYFIILTI